MAILPEALEITEATQESIVNQQPSLTYEIKNGRIGSLIDGEEAIQQFIRKAIQTQRNRYLSYNDEYGSEVESLIGANVTPEILTDELPRILKEAIIFDDRIESVSDFVIEHKSDTLFVSFNVITTQGQTIGNEVTL